MPSDDREKLFENALAHHLRADASPVAGGRADAEILAAYHERSLPAQEMASLKEHVQTCQRCREILNLLGDVVEIPAAPTVAPPLAPAKSNLRLMPARRTPSWRWLAPAGAIAAALLAWIAIRENNPLRAPAQPPVLVAQQSEPATTPPPPSPKTSTINPAVEPPAPSAASSNAPQSAPSTSSARIQNSLTSPLARQNDALAKKRFNDALAQPTRVPQPNEVMRAQTESKADDLGRDALVPPVAPTASGAMAAGAQPTPPRLDASSQPESAAVAGRALQQQQQEIGGLSRVKEKAEMRLANIVSEVTVSAPDGRVSWRVGHAGVIEFSPDAGKTWTVQPSGVITDLLAGSAVSDQVCWLVGRSGTILRTTDAGLHWQKLRSPTQDDLRSVFATDARHATVSPAGATYQTADAGATWQKLSPE